MLCQDLCSSLFCTSIQRTWKTSDTTARMPRGMETQVSSNTSLVPYMMNRLELKFNGTEDRIATVYTHGGMGKSQGAGKGLSLWTSYQFSVVSYKVLVPLAFPSILMQDMLQRGIWHASSLGYMQLCHFCINRFQIQT